MNIIEKKGHIDVDPVKTDTKITLSLKVSTLRDLCDVLEDYAIYGLDKKLVRKNQ